MTILQGKARSSQRQQSSWNSRSRLTESSATESSSNASSQSRPLGHVEWMTGGPSGPSA